MKISRWTGVLTGAVLASVAATGSAAAQESLTIASFGGQYTVSQIEAYHKPYTAETGVVINSVDYNGGLAELRAQVESGNVTWDLMDVETQDLELGCSEGLFAPIDPSILPDGADGTPASEDFIPGTLQECGVGNIIWSNVVAYNNTKFPDEKPTTIADFFDTEKFPGKRGISRRPNGTLEWALIADGVPIDEVYDTLATPEGVDRAFAKLDTIKDDIIVWEAGAQPPQLLADGEVAMSTAYNGRIYTAITEENQPLTIIWDAQIWNSDYFAIPTGGKTETALDFIKFATGTKPLAEQAKYIPYAPVRRSSIALIDKDLVAHLPTGQPNFEETSLKFDAQWWADHADEINERFTVWLAR